MNFSPVNVCSKFHPKSVIQWVEVGTIRWPLLFCKEMRQVGVAPLLSFGMCVRSGVVLLKPPVSAELTMAKALDSRKVLFLGKRGGLWFG